MPTTRRSARLHQFKQRFERSSEVLQNSRQTRRQHQRSVTRQQRLNENRDMESTNTSLVDFSTMPKMDRRQKLQIWQKAREEKRQQEQEQATANAKPPFIVGRARSPFKTMEQFIKGPRRRVLGLRSANVSLAQPKAEKQANPNTSLPLNTTRTPPAAFASQQQQQPVIEVVGVDTCNTMQTATSTPLTTTTADAMTTTTDTTTATMASTAAVAAAGDDPAPANDTDEHEVVESALQPRSLSSVFDREQHAQDLASMLIGLQVASPKQCQLSRAVHMESSNTTITTTMSAREEARLLLDDEQTAEPASTHDTSDAANTGSSEEGMNMSRNDSDGYVSDPVQRFIDLHNAAKADMVALCQMWRGLFAEATAVNSELEGEINRALGQAELLMRKLMPKYLELCHNANNDDATVRLDDLQGYWDARVEAQVMDIKAMFKALDEIRSNNWQHKQETPEPAAPKKRKAKKKVVRKARKGKPSSAVAAFLAKKRAEKRTAATASPQIELAVAPKPASLPAPVPPPSLDDVANGVDALIADNITAASPIAADALPRRKNARLSLRDDSDVETDNDDNGNGIAMVAPITPLFSGKRRTAAGARRNNSMLLTPVRASKTERESLGAEVIFTPVRRSRRTTPSKYRNANTVMEFSTAIEQPNFAYKPNPALDVRADATAQQNATDGAAHHATEQQQQQQEEDIPCTPVNASSTRRRRSSLRALTPNSNLAALLTCETPQQTPQRGGDNADSCAPSPALINLTPRPCTSTPLFMSSRKRPSRARPALACITEDDENTSPNADANTGSSPSSRQNVAAPIFDLLA